MQREALAGFPSAEGEFGRRRFGRSDELKLESIAARLESFADAKRRATAVGVEAAECLMVDLQDGTGPSFKAELVVIFLGEVEETFVNDND